jgi:hypothetical protein
MITNWQKFSTQAQYAAALYNFCVKVETRNNRTPDYSAYNDRAGGVGNVTIGVGFNLNTPSVRAAAFNVLGLVQNDPRLASNPGLNAVENGYIQSLNNAIQNGNDAQFNSVMAQRAANTALTAVLGPLPYPLNDTQVQAIFNAIIPIYENQVNTWLPNIPISQERIALVSLAYNSKVNPVTGIATTTTLRWDRATVPSTAGWAMTRSLPDRGRTPFAAAAARVMTVAPVTTPYGGLGFGLVQS